MPATRTAGRNGSDRKEVEHGRQATPAPAPPVAHILQLQRMAGNAAVTAMLQREPLEAEHQVSPAHEKAHREAAFEQRALDASKKLDEAGYKQGRALRGAGTAPAHAGGAFPKWFTDLQHKLSMSSTWGEAEEEAQQVLADYANHWIAEHGEKVPGNVRHLLDYAGRSSIHAAAAAKGGRQAVSDGMMGGGLSGGKPTTNWCTQATSTGVLEGLKALGFAPVDTAKFFKKIAGKKLKGGNPMMMYAEKAYGEPLLPGDQVMYLFETGQYGGHTVTVLEDLDTSFTHVSGNSGDAIGVNVGESKRIKTPPPSKSGGGKFELGKANQNETKEEREAAGVYIRSRDWGGGVLVYSIVRYGGLLLELEELPNLPPDQQEKVLAEYGLKRIGPAAPPAAVTEG